MPQTALTTAAGARLPCRPITADSHRSARSARQRVPLHWQAQSDGWIIFFIINTLRVVRKGVMGACIPCRDSISLAFRTELRIQRRPSMRFANSTAMDAIGRRATSAALNDPTLAAEVQQVSSRPDVGCDALRLNGAVARPHRNWYREAQQVLRPGIWCTLVHSQRRHAVASRQARTFLLRRRLHVILL
jgi:hypothetical protein